MMIRTTTSWHGTLEVSGSTDSIFAEGDGCAPVLQNATTKLHKETQAARTATSKDIVEDIIKDTIKDIDTKRKDT